ncbi:MAG: RNA polymerase sigma factor [Ignavibacteria bacterium]|nr:RNA polymerase sigma factor [Ignavibacteria bacterium]
MKRIYSDMSDDELFGLMGQDSHKAEGCFAELYARHSPRVNAYCKRIMGDRMAAQDAFQETFTKFFKSASQERNMTNTPAFLLRIARNVCLNMKRGEKKTVEIEDFHLPSESPAYEKSELLKLIMSALELVPFDYREAFVLREYDGLSYQEIADVTETSMATVKIRIFRAKDKLRQILAPYLHDLNKV